MERTCLYVTESVISYFYEKVFFVTGGVRVSWTLMTVVRGCGSRSCNCRLVMVWCLTVVVVESCCIVDGVLVVL